MAALFTKLLNLGSDWEVYETSYSCEKNVILLRIRETAELLAHSRCPKDKRFKVKLYDHVEPRFWRHLNVFNCECLIECSLPRFQCTHCDKVWRVKAPWEGKCKGLSKEFEAFALTLMKEMPVKSAGRILNENDKRLWRVLNAYVEEAHQSVDLSDLTQVGSDELSYRKGHKYVTVFADMEQKRVVYAVKGKDQSTWERFCEDLHRRNGHPHAIRRSAFSSVNWFKLSECA